MERVLYRSTNQLMTPLLLLVVRIGFGRRYAVEVRYVHPVHSILASLEQNQIKLYLDRQLDCFE